jgi:uncharacterized membrane protein YeaQ/YmgE (transglycosylase-associated protein family)
VLNTLACSMLGTMSGLVATASIAGQIGGGWVTTVIAVVGAVGTVVGGVTTFVLSMRRLRNEDAESLRHYMDTQVNRLDAICQRQDAELMSSKTKMAELSAAVTTEKSLKQECTKQLQAKQALLDEAQKMLERNAIYINTLEFHRSTLISTLSAAGVTIPKEVTEVKHG